MEQTMLVGNQEREFNSLLIKSSGQGVGGTQIRLRPIPLSSIPWCTPAPVNLYLRVGRELSLLFRKGQNLSVEAYGELSKQTDNLFYDKESWVDWQLLVEMSLKEILQTQLPIEAKAAIAYGSVTQITKNIFEEFTEKSYQSAQATVGVLNRLMDEPDALNSFFQLTINDYYTYTHSVHVYLYASLLTRALIGDENTSLLNELGVGYLLHDIGKKNIAPEILNKTESLNDKEWATIKTHPQIGFEVLTQASGGLSEEVADIVLHHHEKSDGSGYPNGLRGHETGRYTKICAIADVFDALTTNRSYKNATSKMDALSLMKDTMGHFDEKLLLRFIQI